MPKLYIPIINATLEMLTELNGGVTPKLEHDTVFVYNGPDTPPEIIRDTEDDPLMLDCRWKFSVIYEVDRPSN